MRVRRFLRSWRNDDLRPGAAGTPGRDMMPRLRGGPEKERAPARRGSSGRPGTPRYFLGASAAGAAFLQQASLHSLSHAFFPSWHFSPPCSRPCSRRPRPPAWRHRRASCPRRGRGRRTGRGGGDRDELLHFSPPMVFGPSRNDRRILPQRGRKRGFSRVKARVKAESAGGPPRGASAPLAGSSRRIAPRSGSQNGRHSRLDLELLEQPVEVHLDRLLLDSEQGRQLLVSDTRPREATGVGFRAASGGPWRRAVRGRVH